MKTLRHIRRVGGWVLAAGGLVGLFLLGLLQFDGVSTWLVNGLGARFNPYPGTQLSVGRVSGSWIRTLRFEGVRLTPVTGQQRGGPEILLDSLELRFRLLPLLRRRLDIREAKIAGLRAEVTQQPDSLWDVLLPFQGPAPPDREKEGAGGLRLRFGSVRVHDSSMRVTFASENLSLEPDRLEIEDLALALSDLEREPGRVGARLDTLYARFLPPGESLDRAVVEGRATLADGRLVVPEFTLRSGASDASAKGTLLLPKGEDGEVEEIDFQIRADSLSFRDLSGFVRTLDPTVTAQVDLSLQGRASQVELSGNVTLSDGGQVGLEGTFTPTTSGQVEYDLETMLAGFRPESVLGKGSVGGVVNGRATVAVEGSDLGHLSGERITQTNENGKFIFEYGMLY